MLPFKDLISLGQVNHLVSDIYKYPVDDHFRLEYSINPLMPGQFVLKCLGLHMQLVIKGSKSQPHNYVSAV